MTALTLYGHPFSSYVWKAKIALYARALPFEFRLASGEHPEHIAFVQAHGGPLGKIPLLADGARTVCESTSIIEYLDLHHPGAPPMISPDADAALSMRMLDRIFDNYVMAPTTAIVEEHIRAPGCADATRCDTHIQRLHRSYRWLEAWLADYQPAQPISLVECAAAPPLFYADWVAPIGEDCPRLRAWRAHLLALAPVARCVDEARPWRGFFPPGAPDRD